MNKNISFLCFAINDYNIRILILEHPVMDDCTLTTPCEREKPQVPFQDAELDRSMIKMISFIDRGNFGEVWLGRIQCVDVAVKKSLCTSAREDFLREAKKMHAIWHPQLVQFLGVCIKPESEPILIVTEYMKNGSLSNFLPSPEGLKLGRLELLLILDQVDLFFSFSCVLDFLNCFKKTAKYIYRSRMECAIWSLKLLSIEIFELRTSLWQKTFRSKLVTLDNRKCYQCPLILLLVSKYFQQNVESRKIIVG